MEGDSLKRHACQIETHSVKRPNSYVENGTQICAEEDG